MCTSHVLCARNIYSSEQDSQAWSLHDTDEEWGGHWTILGKQTQIIPDHWSVLWRRLNLVTWWGTILGRQAGTPEAMMVFELRLENLKELSKIKRCGGKTFQTEGREHKSHKARMSLRLEEDHCGWNIARGRCMRGGWRGEQEQLWGL